MMLGNESARAEVVRWIKDWKPGSRPLFLIGPPGVGKTTAIRNMANDFNMYVFELNASDYRTKDRLRELLGNISPVNLMGQRILVFLDEVDGLYSKGDAGGVEFISEFIGESRVPIVMAANEEKDFLKDIIKKSKVVEFKRIPAREIVLYLKHIASQEGLSVANDALEGIVKSSNNDVRYCINQLQALQTGAVYKDVKYSDEEAVSLAMSSRQFDMAVYYINRWNADPERKVSVVAATLFYNQPPDLPRRARWLAEADLLLGRIKRTQEWRLLKYLNYMLAEAMSNMMGVYNEYLIPYTVINERWKREIYAGITDDLFKQVHTDKGFVAAYLVPLYEILVKRGIVVNDAVKRVIGG